MAVTFNHRFYKNWNSLPQSADDLDTLIAWQQENSALFNVDPNHLTLWAFSGAGPLLTSALCSSKPFVTSVVNYFGILNLKLLQGSGEPISSEVIDRFSPADCLDSSAPPMLIARAGKDRAAFNSSIDAFVSRALQRNLSVTSVNHASGRHGFEIYDDDDRSREILQQTVEFIRRH